MKDNIVVVSERDHMKCHFARKDWCKIENKKAKREKKKRLL